MTSNRNGKTLFVDVGCELSQFCRPSTFILKYKLQQEDEITCDSVNEIKMSG